MPKTMQTMSENPSTLPVRRENSVLLNLSDKQLLQITQSLQSTLDPEQLIQRFSMELGAFIVHQGIHYKNKDHEIDLKLGRQARHQCSYTLNTGDEKLGQLSFQRNQKFTASEIESMEHLLCSLLNPLRNALMYQDALRLAQKDPLTGIANRAAFDETIKHELSHAERQDTNCSLLMLDIDHFKLVNDQYGHIIGDCALKEVTRIMNDCKRDEDFVFRYGGEEFVVLMRDTDLYGARHLAERIRSTCDREIFTCSGANINLTVSIGVSTLIDGDTPLTLFERADNALYRAKKNGRNQISIDSSK